jgi:hypothetical protein
MLTKFSIIPRLFLALMAALVTQAVCAGVSRADAVTDWKAQADSNPFVPGVLKFHTAIEHLAQAMFRHGLSSPMDGRAGLVLPVLRLPLPRNPKPQKIDYVTFRKILETLVADLDAADLALSSVNYGDTKLKVDLAAITIDLDGDGKRDEAFTTSMLQLMGAPATAPAGLVLNFDAADIHWMRGYGRFISSFAQIMLAFDFEETFKKTFHLYFPNGGFELGDRLAVSTATQRGIMGVAREDGTIGDVIAFIHLINWTVVEPQRLADARQRLVSMADLSAQSWAAARLETDNDLEWLPNEKQTQAITGTTNTPEIIDGWLAVMAEFRSVLEGKKLLPHWRFDKGVNLRRFFDEAKSFDLILFLTGTDAVNFIEDGPVSSGTTWNGLMSAFRGNFMGYAIWFN